MADLRVHLEPPAAVVAIADQLEAAGFETWCVGGAVRDALLGLPNLDWDLATSATPAQVKRIFRRTIPIGEEFGTVGVVDPAGQMHEVTTFRHDVTTDGRHAVVAFGASLDEDLARRDFTINAIAWSTSRQRLHDPFGGRADLSRGMLRAVGEPRQRMVEDRLRALRALRFAGRFGLEIEEATWRAIVESAPALHRLSRERVQQELVKTLEQVRRPSASLRLWERSGALREVLPLLADAPSWSLAAADGVGFPDATGNQGIARRRVQVRLASLLAGFPHRAISSTLTGLRFATRDAQRIAHLAAVAGVVRGSLSSGEAVSLGAVREWASRARRTDFADVLRVAMASAAAAGGVSPAVQARWPAFYRSAVRCAWRDPVEISDLALDGEDLLRAGVVRPGPQLGELLRGLLAWVLEDPARNTVEMLLARAQSMTHPPA